MQNYISKMYNGLEVVTEQLSNSEQPYWSLQMLPDAPSSAESKGMCSHVLWDYFTGTPQCSKSRKTEYKNIMKSV